MHSGISITAYDATWRTSFDEEARRIRAAFGKGALRIDHVGSTAVAGLAAKPVIDIQVSVASLEPQGLFGDAMAELGYTHVKLGALDLVYPFFKRPATWPSTHHVHLCAFGAAEERKHLAFRDYLRAHSSMAATYADLKRKLAASCAGTGAQQREAYSMGKTVFVEAVVALALGKGYPALGPSDG